MTTETTSIPQNETGIIEHENTLAGKRALITGASRDIGASLAISLASQGVEVMGVYRDPAKKKRADATQRVIEEAGGKVDLFVSDVTTEEGLLMIDGALGQEPLDFLVLSASGKSDEINVTAAQNLIDLALPRMKEGGVVMLMQSIPGHLAPQLDAPQFSTEVYDEVGRSKRRGEDALRERISELEENGIKAFVVCPPIVEGTSNIRLFRMRDDKVDKIHEEVSLKLGIPSTVGIKAVGDKVADLLDRSNQLPTGYTELFSDVTDTRSALGRWYDHPRIYVDTSERWTDDEEKRSGIARSIVSLEQTIRSDEPENFVDELLQDENGLLYGKFTPRPEHATGHFREGSGLPPVLAGHKHIRSAIETIQRIHAEGLLSNSPLPLTVRSIRNAEFKEAIIPKGDTEMFIKPREIHVNPDGTVSCSISIQSGEGAEFSSIEELVLTPYNPVENPHLKSDQLIESMAQAAGVIGLDMDGARFPQFKKIGLVQFEEGPLPVAGDGMTYEALVLPSEKRGYNFFTANVGARVNGDPIAIMQGAEVMVFPKRALSRLK